MKILILGAGKMGSFFTDLLSFQHETAVYDIDPKRLRFVYNTCRFTTLEEIHEFAPELVINAATVKYTIEVPNECSADLCKLLIEKFNIILTKRQHSADCEILYIELEIKN